MDVYYEDMDSQSLGTVRLPGSLLKKSVVSLRVLYSAIVIHSFLFIHQIISNINSMGLTL